MAQGKAASYGLDNLSRLPDELLLHIVSLFPMKDAVCTSALSTRWRYLYASSSNLDFCSSGRNMTCVDVINAVDQVFYCRYRRPINRFRICWTDSGDFDPMHFYGWIKCVMWHGIQEIDIDIPDDLLLPDVLSTLFTCKTLVILRLKLEFCFYSDSDFGLELPAKVFLPSLNVLALHNVISFSDDNDACERLFSNCPVLEHFDYCFKYKDCKLIICHPTLKRLAIRDQGFSSDRFEIVINAPRVTYLEYSIISVDCHTVIDLRSLIEAEIGFDYKDGYTEYDIDTSNATSVIRRINNVHKLNMSGGTLMGNANEMDIVKYLLQSARVLETLKIGTSDIKREELSKIRELLLTFPRASNKCSVVLVDK